MEPPGAPRDQNSPPTTSPTAAHDARRLLVDPRTGTPIPPKAQPGYYPGYSTLSQQAFWDEATRQVVLERVHTVPENQYFSPDEAALLEAVAARILPQDDRDADHRIPIVPRIDQRLFTHRGAGYQYRDTPPDGEAFRLGLRAIEAIASHLCGRAFQALEPHEQDDVLATIHDGRPPTGEEIWQAMPVRHFWMLLVTDVVEAYYAHPWAWDEIGFGGPAYPRGYMRLRAGRPEPWEQRERRYEWQAPPGALSDRYVPIDREDPLEAQLGGKPQGASQGGTH
ncbi:MAG: gluconate 2-dehydrogenase subunit 3 family protein [Ktedonobacterales bacterium]|nr:gluconate 2-dehydrogenase subunit 3 family protein [Ktedonobacterales bacterium]